MKSRAVRLTLLGLFVVTTGVSAYLFWVGESHARVENGAARTFETRIRSAERSVLELRAAQQAYVAAGQGDQFWISKVAAATAGLRDALGLLRSTASSPHAQSAIDNASGSLQDFEQMDSRARAYVAGGQKLLASDLIFADALEVTNAAVASLDQARAAELQARDDVIRQIRQRQLFALGAAASGAFLAIILLVPRVEPTVEPSFEAIEPAPLAAARGGLSLNEYPQEGWTPARPLKPERPFKEEAEVVDTPPVILPIVDLTSIAALCTDLARVVDTRSLPAILERAAHVLDAPGIVVWISDPDGRELSPIVTHGYSSQIVVRLGTISRDAENATAAAFRTSLVQTVSADDVSNGAIAAPLVTPGGSVGVMAAEVRHAGEADPAKLAAATIVAAQLATLVGMPASRAHAKTEAAGAGV